MLRYLNLTVSTSSTSVSAVASVAHGGRSTAARTGDLSALISSAVSAACASVSSTGGTVQSVRRIFNATRSAWVEYRVVFSGSCHITKLATSPYNVSSSAAPGGVPSVLLATLQGSLDYPVFHSTSTFEGFAPAGQYTCYRRDLGYAPFTFHTASLDAGIIASVKALPYSIGYTVLEAAQANSCPIASLINQAGNVVVASTTSVDFAMMELGSDLSATMSADLSDGKTSQAWPITSYSYFVMMKNSHIGSCERRRAAMRYLYNYYQSSVVKQIAADTGFATLSDLIRDIVVQKLVNEAKCSNGEYALAEYRKPVVGIPVPNALSSFVQMYIESFSAINSSFALASVASGGSLGAWESFRSSFNATPAESHQRLDAF